MRTLRATIRPSFIPPSLMMRSAARGEKPASPPRGCGILHRPAGEHGASIATLGGDIDAPPKPPPTVPPMRRSLERHVEDQAGIVEREEQRLRVRIAVRPLASGTTMQLAVSTGHVRSAPTVRGDVVASAKPSRRRRTGHAGNGLVGEQLLPWYSLTSGAPGASASSSNTAGGTS
jgi:hypothetical protein